MQVTIGEMQDGRFVFACPECRYEGSFGLAPASGETWTDCERCGRRFTIRSRASVQRVQRQHQLLTQMQKLNDETFALYHSLQPHIDRSLDHLIRAEAEFEDHAFGTFWDRVERATRELAEFDEGVRTLTSRRVSFQDVAAQYDNSPPQFAITPAKLAELAVARTAAERLHQVVRRGQRDFQFAMIYEQRKTNQLLLAGFTSLGEALEQLGDQLAESLNTLGVSINSSASSLGSSLVSSLDNLGNSVSVATHESQSATINAHACCPHCQNVNRGSKLLRCQRCGTIFCNVCASGFTSNYCPRGTDHGPPVLIGHVG